MKRNYGIDLLRMVAMVFVVVLHIVGIGGIITGSELLSPQFLTAQLLRIAMLCAVNCYALISGFVGWNRRPGLSGLGKLCNGEVGEQLLLHAEARAYGHRALPVHPPADCFGCAADGLGQLNLRKSPPCQLGLKVRVRHVSPPRKRRCSDNTCSSISVYRQKSTLN